MPPGESIKIFQTIKANNSYDDDEFEKRTEMRKIFYIYIKETDIYIPQPVWGQVLAPKLIPNFKKNNTSYLKLIPVKYILISLFFIIIPHF